MWLKTRGRDVGKFSVRLLNASSIAPPCTLDQAEEGGGPVLGRCLKVGLSGNGKSG